VASVALAPVHANRHYHAITEDPINWRDLVAWMQRDGHMLELVPPMDWYNSLCAALPVHREWTSLALLVAQDPARSFWSDANIFSMQFDASRLRAALEGTGVVCPPLDDRLVGTYVNAIAGATPI
jgi:hypothetical protein